MKDRKEADDEDQRPEFHEKIERSGYRGNRDSDEKERFEHFPPETSIRSVTASTIQIPGAPYLAWRQA